MENPVSSKNKSMIKVEHAKLSSGEFLTDRAFKFSCNQQGSHIDIFVFLKLQNKLNRRITYLI